MKQRIPTAIAIIVGFITLLGYLIPGLKIHHLFIRWAAILAAIAFLLGIFNLLTVHLGRIVDQKKDWLFSMFLVMSAMLVIMIGAIEGKGAGGPTMTWIFENTLIPLEATAASLLVFFMTAAAFRTMRIRPGAHTFLFILTIILVLLPAIPLVATLAKPLGQIRDWLVHVFAMAGIRGLLLGVALGTITTGLRVLLGIDRPHSEREP
ncbi:MAG: hypothetical protein JXA42_01655 [Anaerolineales bacterium]|nr:hypothetical protein [Anaerolineales bacterium]